MLLKDLFESKSCNRLLEPESNEDVWREAGNRSYEYDDFVHDVQFDYYGKRIATCSSDEKIKIWERTTDINFADVANANLSEAQKIQEEADQ